MALTEPADHPSSFSDLVALLPDAMHRGIHTEMYASSFISLRYLKLTNILGAKTCVQLVDPPSSFVTYLRFLKARALRLHPHSSARGPPASYQHACPHLQAPT